MLNFNFCALRSHKRIHKWVGHYWTGCVLYANNVHAPMLVHGVYNVLHWWPVWTGMVQWYVLMWIMHSCACSICLAVYIQYIPCDVYCKQCCSIYYTVLGCIHLQWMLVDWLECVTYCNTYYDSFIRIRGQWYMEMFLQHCSFVLCSFAVYQTHTVHVYRNASLGRPFNSNVGGGDITSFPPTGEGDTI